MNDVTRLLDAVKKGDQAAAEELLPLTYKELRRISGMMMANEKGGHTLQPTALVHEAYLRLVGPDGGQPTWDTRGHFFAVAAEAMRRILIDHARKKQTGNVVVIWIGPFLMKQSLKREFPTMKSSP